MKNLNQILNLVRHEAGKTPVVDDPFPMTEQRARNLIESAAALVRRASQFPAETLTRISDRAARCQCHRQLDTHCGACREYDTPSREASAGEGLGIERGAA